MARKAAAERDQRQDAPENAARIDAANASERTRNKSTTELAYEARQRIATSLERLAERNQDDHEIQEAIDSDIYAAEMTQTEPYIPQRGEVLNVDVVADPLPSLAAAQMSAFFDDIEAQHAALVAETRAEVRSDEAIAAIVDAKPVVVDSAAWEKQRFEAFQDDLYKTLIRHK